MPAVLRSWLVAQQYSRSQPSLCSDRLAPPYTGRIEKSVTTQQEPNCAYIELVLRQAVGQSCDTSDTLLKLHQEIELVEAAWHIDLHVCKFMLT